MDSKGRWQDGVKGAAGLWLFVSPWAMGVTGDLFSSWNAWIVGIIMLISSAWAWRVPKATWLQWVGGLAGAWLAISPTFVLIASDMLWSNIAVGVVSIILSSWLLITEREKTKRLSA
ncbi:MAG: SPW repeat protein [Limnochordia bacterium]|jgi:hypothetical protein